MSIASSSVYPGNHRQQIIVRRVQEERNQLVHGVHTCDISVTSTRIAENACGAPSQCTQVPVFYPDGSLEPSGEMAAFSIGNAEVAQMCITSPMHSESHHVSGGRH
jgi:hypothetical protein